MISGSHKIEHQKRIYDAILNSLGPAIQGLMNDDSVVEIMVNPDGCLWIEEAGKGMRDSGEIIPFEKTESLIRLVASNSDMQCDEESPSLSAILPISNARFQAFFPPVCRAPFFVIRKRAVAVFTLEDYVRSGIMATPQAEFLRAAVWEKKNILIAGGTGSGKTTLANAILHEISKTDDRVFIIEDTPELQSSSKNTVHLYTRPEVGFTAQRAVKEVLRCRPDRIIVGEVRDGTALDLLKAWNTGHSGGIATIHANNSLLALRRFESLVSEVVVNIPRDLIADTINVVVHIKRTKDGRVVDNISEVTDFNQTTYCLQEISENSN